MADELACPGALHPAPSWHLPFLDFPTAWAIAREGLLHTDRRCSYIQAWGGFLCDCGAVEREWKRRRAVSRCCDLHGRNCEQGGNECCQWCSESQHFALDHGGTTCVLAVTP